MSRDISHNTCDARHVPYDRFVLGYRGHADWRDMSEYVVHFTSANGDLTAYDVMMTILSTGRLLSTSTFGMARGLGGLGASQRSVCFSEIPLDLLDRLVSNRSSYGLGFKQDKVISEGGGRVWYVDKGGPVANVLQRMKAQRTMHMEFDPADDFWKLTPFVDHPGTYDGVPYRFEWEREWRVPSPFNFAPDDVAFLFLPESLHTNAASFFSAARVDNRGPAYECPLLDPQWDEARLQARFKQVA